MTTRTSETPDDREDGFAEVARALSEINERLARIETELAAIRKRQKRRIFKTRDERDAWFARSEENRRRLEERLAKLRAELAPKQKPA